MNDPVRGMLDRLKSVKWIAYVVVAGLTVVGIANVTDALRDIYRFYQDVTAPFHEQKLESDALVAQARETSRALIEFILTRHRHEPELDRERWDDSTRAMSHYGLETQALYARDFAGKVAHLREEFLKRGIRDEDLDQLFQHPTNYIGLRLVAAALVKLSEDLASD